MSKLILYLGWAVALSAQATSIEGTVLYVYDGDTLLLAQKQPKQRVKVRLADIDAPEIRQAYGKQARLALNTKILGRKIQIKTQGTDKYQRVIGRLALDKRCIECEMVVEGHAWVLPKRWQRVELYKLEARARQARSGLWHQKVTLQEPPWSWRKQH